MHTLVATLVFSGVAAIPGHVLSAEKISMVGLFKDKALVEIDGQRRLLRKDSTSTEGLRLIAADSQSAVIEVHGQRRTFTLGAGIGTQFDAPPAKAMVKIWPDANSMYKVQGSINDFTVQFLVDTGATLVALSEKEAKRIGLPYLKNGIAGQTSTASGISKTYYVKAAKIRIGAIELRDVDAAVLPGDFPRDVLLGNSFLSRIAMVRNGQLMELRGK